MVPMGFVAPLCQSCFLLSTLYISNCNPEYLKSSSVMNSHACLWNPKATADAGLPQTWHWQAAVQLGGLDGVEGTREMWTPWRSCPAVPSAATEASRVSGAGRGLVCSLSFADVALYKLQFLGLPLRTKDKNVRCSVAPLFLPGESQGWGSLVGCRLWGRTESDTTEVTLQQQQQNSSLV